MTTRHTASSARAEGKSPGPPARPRRAYNDEERRAALDRVTVVGLAAAHRETGIPRRTLSDWTRAAGVDLGEHARARTARATATATATAAEARLSTMARLEKILDDQLAVYAVLSRLERRAAELVAAQANDSMAVQAIPGTRAGKVLVSPTNPDLVQALGLVELLTRATPKRDLVGAVGQAVEKLELLRGDATERGDVVVHFGIPRPSPRESDAAAIDEVDLGRAPLPLSTA